MNEKIEAKVVSRTEIKPYTGKCGQCGQRIFEENLTSSLKKISCFWVVRAGVYHCRNCRFLGVFQQTDKKLFTQTPEGGYRDNGLVQWGIVPDGQNFLSPSELELKDDLVFCLGDILFDVLRKYKKLLAECKK